MGFDTPSDEIVCFSPAAGRVSRASQPRASVRFASTRVPECASAICRDSTSPIPVPPGLVVKNGTNRFAESGRPGPSSCTVSSNESSRVVHFTRTPPPVVARRVHGVREQVDQQLVELVAVGLQRHVRARHDLHRQPRFEPRHALHPRRDVDVRERRRRQLCELRILA